jgi:predicted anti-sigma-YlaC factor YlaD
VSGERGWEIDCIDLVELVTGYLEGALDEERRITIEAHLRLCDGCQTYVEQVRETVRVLGHLPLHAAQDLPDEVRRQLLAAFRADYPR